MVGGEIVGKGRVSPLAWVPHIIGMVLLIRILFDGEVSISRQEVAVERTLLDISSLLGVVLGFQHAASRRIIWLVHHGGERFQIGSVVPLVLSPLSGIGHIAGKQVP